MQLSKNLLGHLEAFNHKFQASDEAFLYICNIYFCFPLLPLLPLLASSVVWEKILLRFFYNVGIHSLEVIVLPTFSVNLSR